MHLNLSLSPDMATEHLHMHVHVLAALRLTSLPIGVSRSHNK